MDTTSQFNQRLELFFGQASEAMARVYARVRDFARPAGGELAGNLTGPSCLYAETLPARYPLIDRGPGDAMLAEAIVPEPCFWTPEMPQLYQVSVQLRQGANVIASAERLFGLRALGSSSRKLIFDGRRWVLRGVRRDALADASLDDWHAADAAMYVRNPDNLLCRSASRIGVLLVAELDAADPREIQRLGSWPAVAIVAAPSDSTPDLGGLKHNLLLAARYLAGQPLAAPSWAQLALVDLETVGRAARSLAGFPLPVIAAQSTAKRFSTVRDARAACDRLQQALAARADLAGMDFAGYLA